MAAAPGEAKGRKKGRKRAGSSLSEKAYDTSDLGPDIEAVEFDLDGKYIVTVYYRTDEETKVRVIMMILGYPESEIQRVLAYMKANPCD